MEERFYIFIFLFGLYLYLIISWDDELDEELS
jgi:hypothetical protein